MRSEATVKRMLTWTRRDLVHVDKMLTDDDHYESMLLRNMQMSMKARIHVLRWVLEETAWRNR